MRWLSWEILVLLLMTPETLRYTGNDDVDVLTCFGT